MGNMITTGLDAEHWAQTKSGSCNIYTNFRRNRNSSFLGISGFEGIPQNLVVNFIAWMILHILFIILRKKAWNYGRLAVMQKEEIKWTDMFYGGYQQDDIEQIRSSKVPMIVASAMSSNQHATVAVIADNLNGPADIDPLPILPRDEGPMDGMAVRVDDKGVVTVNIMEPGMSTDFGEINLEKDNDSVIPDNEPTASVQNVTISEIKDKGYLSWIKIVFNLTDQQYRDKCGPDCVFYLSFQRHLIVLAFIITVCSLSIILPINLHSAWEANGDRTTEFSDTSIIYLENNHNFLWAHIILSIAFLFISIAIMRRYSKILQFTDEDDSDISRTVIIIGLKKASCKEDLLRAHFAESYHGLEISEISFAYDISKLYNVEFNRLSAVSAKIYFQELLENQERNESTPSSSRPMMRPYVCGVCGCWCKYCHKCKETDAIAYYTELERKYTEQLGMERQRARERPLGIAFVTFTSVESAERIVEDYACSARIFLHTPVSEVSKVLNSNQWLVKYAPPPQDINWENLTLDVKKWYVKFLLVNMVLAVIAIVFTTPVYLFTIFAKPRTLRQGMKDVPGRLFEGSPQTMQLASVIVDTLPTIIVWILGLTLIWIVYRSDRIIGFWTRTAGNLSEMIKVFVFLSFMVIILPSLGVTSFSYFLNRQNRLTWSCIFYKDNGALFVNYICTSSLVGTAAELMRLPELLQYAIKLSFARSKAEIGAIRRSVLWDFQIGTSYAWTMLHFAIFTCFSVIYPLVTPFGLLYLCLKHWTDRYNIYFAYSPCKVSKEVHGTAVNFVIMCMFMLQINLLAYVHFHLGESSMEQGEGMKSANPEIRALQVFSLLGFSVTAALFLGQLCFNVCADFSPIHHYKSIAEEDEEQRTLFEAHPPEQPSEMADGQISPPYSVIRQSSSAIHRSVSENDNEKPAVRARAKRSTLRLQSASDNQSSRHPRSGSVGSGYSSGKPYGRYIPPLLRPEFVRLMMLSDTSGPPHNRQGSLQ